MELDISGARIFFTLPIDVPVLGPLRISETMVVSWIVMILITGLCIWLTHDLKEEHFQTSGCGRAHCREGQQLCNRKYG